MDSSDELKKKLAQACRMLTREGLLASSGHVSARLPDAEEVLISPGNVSRNEVQSEDIVTVGLDSSQLAGSRKAPWETEIHTGIYRARPDVRGIVHSHPLYSVTFSVTGKPIVPVCVHGAIFGDGVPVFDHVGHVDSRELGDALAQSLGSCRAVILKMHGVAVVGSSLEEAFVASLQLEENAEKQLWAEISGSIQPMSAEEVERCIRQSFRPPSILKRWAYYQDKERRALRRGGC